jgi:SPP1 gp7 family putative phage head morphogenesis protein
LESREIPDIEPDEILITEQLFSTSLLLGMDHASETIILDDASVNLKALPYDDAVNFLKGRVSVTGEEWKALEPKLRFKAFTISRMAQSDYIETARGRLISAMENGEGIAETWNDIKAIAKEDGSQISPGYWETVYRTNIQTCYNTGKKMEFAKNPPEAIALLVIDDLRTSPTCRPLIGLCLPGDHPFWKTNWPPFHYSCRTTVRRIGKHEIGTSIQVNNTPMSTLRKKFKPQDGFGTDPLDSGNWWMLHSSQIRRGIDYGIITEITKSENVIADYDSVWTDYKRYDGKEGGWYDLINTPPIDWAKNKKAVSFLANNGYRIKVIPELKDIKQQGWKNPDVFIDGVIADIKIPEALTKRGVDGRLRAAEQQNLSTTIMDVPEEMDVDLLKRGIKGHIASQHNKIKRVIILYKGVIHDLSAENILQDLFGF